MSGLSVQKPPTSSSDDASQPKGRDIIIDYLRSFIIVMVVLVHAAGAYTTYHTFNPTQYFESSVPIVDASHWRLLDPIVLVFDSFLMPLLFFVSGLFTFHSLDSKEGRGFFTARLRRLGIPFLAGVLLVVPLAYWPSYLASTPESQIPYLARFFTSDGWPTGPMWFLWVLLLFDGIVALAGWIAPGALAKLRHPPTVLTIFLVTIASFLAFNLFLPINYWLSIGPFDLEPARVGLYFASFLMGMAMGTGQQWHRREWPRYWVVLLGLGTLSFFVWVALKIEMVQLPRFASQLAQSVTFAVTSVGLYLGFFGAFRRFIRRQRPIFNSINANSFGIYVIHYLFVIWIQFVLLSMAWPAWIKFGVAFIGGLALSWGTSASIRLIPAVRRIL
jgi:glucan biosynthesis protein C